MNEGGFSLDQLMELAGLSVSQAGMALCPTENFSYLCPGSGSEWLTSYVYWTEVYRVHPPSKGRNVLVACGPGNNGTEFELDCFEYSISRS